VSDDHHGLTVEARQTADDGVVISKAAIAVQFLEVGKDVLDVIQGVGALWMARDLGDLSENAEYNEAREDQAFNESRVEELKNILKNAVLVEGEAVNHSAVSVGSCVLTSSKFGEKEFTIVGTTEANPAAGFISNESPLGSAFLGKRPGDEIAIKTPNGEVKYKIVDIM